MKPLFFLGASRKAITGFPAAARLAFAKKSGKTPKHDIDTANTRYRQLMEARK